MSLSTNRSKHILIIGGMGPQASVYAHEMLIKEATANGAGDNESYPRITHLSINVKDFISRPTYRDEAREYILRCLQDVNLEHVDTAFIACNTAHILASDIVKATGLPLVSLMDVTAEYFAVQGDISHVGLLATPSTLQTGLYRKGLGERLTVIETDGQSSTRIEGIIRQVIAGGNRHELAQVLQTEVDTLKATGAQKVVLGCTELSLLGAHLTDDAIVDPLILTIRNVLS